MDVRPLAVLLLALPASAGTTRVELTPELGTGVKGPAVSGLVPLQLSAGALTPLSLTPALPAAVALTPSPLLNVAAPAALVPVALTAAPIKAAPVAGEAPLVIKSLSETPALETSKMGAGEASAATEADFMARAQLGGPSALTPGAAASSGDFKPVKKGHLTLVHSAKAPAIVRAPRAVEEPSDKAELPFDLVTPQSLRALVSDGSTRLLTLTVEGTWRVRERDSVSPRPTPQELLMHSRRRGRFFIASKSGLVEWNPNVDEGALLAEGPLERFLLKFGPTSGLALSRLGAASRSVSWKKAEKEGLDGGRAPVDENVLLSYEIPLYIKEELPIVAAKLGYELTDERKADALKRSNGYRMYWHSSWSYKDHPDNTGIPDGHFRSDFGVRLMIKPDWRRLKDRSANFQPLYAHEYTHWLQNEGHVSYKYGGEIAAVAVEILRAIELIGYDAVREGGAGTVHPGNWNSFEGGRVWAAGGFKEETVAYSKGALAGAAFEAGFVSGRPEAAWEFLRLVIAGDKNPQKALSPVQAWAKVVGPR